MSSNFDHSRFDDIFGDSQDTDDVSLESALEASKMQPSETQIVEVYDTELGFVTEEITVEPSTDAGWEISQASPTAVDGIFYSLDDGWIVCDVDDNAESKRIRFVGEDTYMTRLTDADIAIANQYRDEIGELYADDE